VAAAARTKAGIANDRWRRTDIESAQLTRARIALAALAYAVLVAHLLFILFIRRCCPRRCDARWFRGWSSARTERRARLSA
jgi:hypothetical protein